MGYELDLENPQTICEKLQWLKIYNQDDRYTSMVDKYEAKKIAAELLGGILLIFLGAKILLEHLGVLVL